MKKLKVIALILALFTVFSCAAVLASCGKGSELSSYDLAKQAGFTGTEEEWNAVLAGGSADVEGDIASVDTRYEYAPDGTRKKVTEITLADGTVKTVTETSEATYVRKGFAENDFYAFPEGKEGSLLFIAVDETGHTEYREVKNKDLKAGSVNWQIPGTYPIVYEFAGETVRHTVYVDDAFEEDDIRYRGSGYAPNYDSYYYFFLREDENGDPIFDSVGFTYRFEAYDEITKTWRDFLYPFDPEFDLEVFPQSHQFMLTLPNGSAYTQSYRSGKLTDAELAALDQSVCFLEGTADSPTVYVPLGAKTPFDGISDVFMHTIEYDDQSCVYFTPATVNDLVETFSAEAVGTTEYHFKKVNGHDVAGSVKVSVFDPADPDSTSGLMLVDSYDLTARRFPVDNPDEVVLRAVFSAPDAMKPILYELPLSEVSIYEGEADLTTVGVKCVTLPSIGYNDPCPTTVYGYDDAHNVVSFYPGSLAHSSSSSGSAISVGSDIEAALLGSPMDGRYFTIEYASPVDGQPSAVIPFNGDMISFSTTDTSAPGKITVTLSYGGITLGIATVLSVKEISSVFEYVSLSGFSSLVFNYVQQILICRPGSTEEQFLSDVICNCALYGYTDPYSSGIEIPLTKDMFDLSRVDFTKADLYPATINAGGLSHPVRIAVFADGDQLIDTIDKAYRIDSFGTFRLPVSQTPISDEDLFSYAESVCRSSFYVPCFKWYGSYMSMSSTYAYVGASKADFSKVDTTKEGEYTAWFSYLNLKVPMTVNVVKDPHDVLYISADSIWLYLPLGAKAEVPADDENVIWAWTISNFGHTYNSVFLRDTVTDFSEVDMKKPGTYTVPLTYEGFSADFTVCVYDPAVNVDEAYVYYSGSISLDATEKGGLKALAEELADMDAYFYASFWNEIAPEVWSEKVELTEENLVKIFGLTDADFVRPGYHVVYGSYTAPGSTVPYTDFYIDYFVNGKTENVTSSGAYRIVGMDEFFQSVSTMLTLYSDGTCAIFDGSPMNYYYASVDADGGYERVGTNQILVDISDFGIDVLFTVDETAKTLTPATVTGRLVKTMEADYYGDDARVELYSDGTAKITLGEENGYFTFTTIYHAWWDGTYSFGRINEGWLEPYDGVNYLYD